MHKEVSDIAALLSDPGRAAILMALMGGTAMPAGQLALIANVAPQTASTHLAKLVDGRLLTVEQQGRHRYYRLADKEVAHAIEALLAITRLPKSSSAAVARLRSPQESLVYARTCYSHLAGRLGVKIADALQDQGLLVRREPRLFMITSRGREWFAQLGIAVTERQMKDVRFARRCLDWTERRHHVAGQLGSELLTRFRQLRWIAPIRDTRAVRVTLEGERNLWKLLRINGRNHSG